MIALRPEPGPTAALLALPDLPPAVQQTIGAGLVRALGLVSRDYASSVAAGYVESLDEFDARMTALEETGASS